MTVSQAKVFSFSRKLRQLPKTMRFINNAGLQCLVYEKFESSSKKRDLTGESDL